MTPSKLPLHIADQFDAANDDAAEHIDMIAHRTGWRKTTAHHEDCWSTIMDVIALQGSQQCGHLTANTIGKGHYFAAKRWMFCDQCFIDGLPQAHPNIVPDDECDLCRRLTKIFTESVVQLGFCLAYINACTKCNDAMRNAVEAS